MTSCVPGVCFACRSTLDHANGLECFHPGLYEPSSYPNPSSPHPVNLRPTRNPLPPFPHPLNPRPPRNTPLPSPSPVELFNRDKCAPLRRTHGVQVYYTRLCTDLWTSISPGQICPAPPFPSPPLSLPLWVSHARFCSSL